MWLRTISTAALSKRSRSALLVPPGKMMPSKDSPVESAVVASTEISVPFLPVMVPDSGAITRTVAPAFFTASSGEVSSESSKSLVAMMAMVLFSSSAIMRPPLFGYAAHSNAELFYSRSSFLLWGQDPRPPPKTKLRPAWNQPPILKSHTSPSCMM